MKKTKELLKSLKNLEKTEKRLKKMREERQRIEKLPEKIGMLTLIKEIITHYYWDIKLR